MTPNEIPVVDNRAMLKCPRHCWPYILASTISPKHPPSPTRPTPLVPLMLSSCVWVLSNSSPNPLENHNVQDWEEFSKVRDSSMCMMSVLRNPDREKEEGQKLSETSHNSWWGGREMKDSLGRLFLVNMGPSKWKKQDTTFLEKRKYDPIPH